MNRSALLLSLTLLCALPACASLAYTIEAGKFDDARKQIEQGANVNDNSECFTPLMIASWKGNRDLVQLLLSKGADPKARSRQCNYTRTIGPIRFRFRAGARTALDGADDVEVARLLLARGADPRVGGYEEHPRYAFWRDSLSNAVVRRKLDVVRALVEAGAPVAVYNDEGKNRLLDYTEKSTKSEDQAIVAYLKSKGAAHLDTSEAKLAATDAKVMNVYRHIATGAVTTMDMSIAKALFENPSRFNPITFDAASQSFYHYAEFVWVDTNQNLHEWYVLRKLRKK